jgi:hypothetical protein
VELILLVLRIGSKSGLRLHEMGLGQRGIAVLECDVGQALQYFIFKLVVSDEIFNRLMHQLEYLVLWPDFNKAAGKNVNIGTEIVDKMAFPVSLLISSNRGLDSICFLASLKLEIREQNKAKLAVTRSTGLL